MRMLNRSVLITVFTSIIFSVSAFAASISVDRSSLPYGDYLTVTIRVKNRSFPHDYNLAPLKKDFIILAKRVVNRSDIADGILLPKSYMLLEIVPKHYGKIIIPALQVSNETTQPLTIKVNYSIADLSINGELKNSFLVASTDVKNPYLEQQVIYTVKLFTRRAVHDGRLQDPTIRSALVRRLGHDRNYELPINGKKYHVFVRRYAIFPIKTGKLEIIPSIFTGKIGDIGERNKLRLVAPLLNLMVKPVPGLFKNQWWVPAKSLTVSESWLPVKPKFRVGHVVTRVLTLRGVGLTAMQLPQIYQGHLSNVHTYALAPISKSAAFGTNVIGIWQQKINITPTRKGVLKIPAIKLKWWSTVTNSMKIADIPKRNVMVLPSRVSVRQSQADLTDVVSPMHGFGKSPVDILVKLSHLWLWLVFLLFFSALIGSLIWSINRKRVMQHEKELAIGEERKRSLRLARKLVQEAALANDARQTRNALLKWAELRWYGQVFLGLPNVIDVIDDDELKAEIADLQRILYSEAQLKWNGTNFWNTFEDVY